MIIRQKTRAELIDTLRKVPYHILQWDLRNTDLRGVNLENIDLKFIDFQGSDFSGANLQGATFYKANLKGVRFVQANLSNATFQHAHLQETHFIKATLRYTDFSYANLENSNLTYSDLEYANFYKARLVGADLSYTNLRHANLLKTDLQEVDLQYANLYDVELPSHNLCGTNFSQCTGLGTPNILEQLQTTEKGFLAYKSFGEYKDCPWDISIGTTITENVDGNLFKECSYGINVGNLQWVSLLCTNQIYVVEIPFTAQIIVPYNSNGKFRVNKCTILRKYKKVTYPKSLIEGSIKMAHGICTCGHTRYAYYINVGPDMRQVSPSFCQSCGFLEKGCGAKECFKRQCTYWFFCQGQSIGTKKT